MRNWVCFYGVLRWCAASLQCCCTSAISLFLLFSLSGAFRKYEHFATSSSGIAFLFFPFYLFLFSIFLGRQYARYFLKLRNVERERSRTWLLILKKIIFFLFLGLGGTETVTVLSFLLLLSTVSRQSNSCLLLRSVPLDYGTGQLTGPAIRGRSSGCLPTSMLCALGSAWPAGVTGWFLELFLLVAGWLDELISFGFLSWFLMCGMDVRVRLLCHSSYFHWLGIRMVRRSALPHEASLFPGLLWGLIDICIEYGDIGVVWIVNGDIYGRRPYSSESLVM